MRRVCASRVGEPSEGADAGCRESPERDRAGGALPCGAEPEQPARVGDGGAGRRGGGGALPPTGNAVHVETVQGVHADAQVGGTGGGGERATDEGEAAAGGDKADGCGGRCPVRTCVQQMACLLKTRLYFCSCTNSTSCIGFISEETSPTTTWLPSFSMSYASPRAASPTTRLSLAGP